MTYFWLCISAYAALNGTVIAVMVHDMWVDKRDEKTTGGAR